MNSVAQQHPPAVGPRPGGVSESARVEAGECPILAAFRTRGTTARQWALSRGHHPATVYQVIRVWGQRGRRPLGGLGRVILRDLRAELGADVVPETDASAPRRAGRAKSKQTRRAR
jgi:hypothetical protein